MIYAQGSCPDCGKPNGFLRGETSASKLRCPPCFVKAFISLRCCHTQGRWAKETWQNDLYKGRNGKSLDVKFALLDWQHEVIDRAFSVDKNGDRTTRHVYLEIPKKNGKTEFGAALALYMLCMDDEPGAEVYSAAGSRDQAGKVYQAASYMVRNNEELAKRLQIVPSRKMVIDSQTDSFYRVLSSEAFTAHGINPHCIVFDELHAQPNRELYDVLVEGTDVARPQQLIFTLTTAGIADKEHIAWQTHHYALQIDEGIIQDPKFTPILYCIREGQDWEDPKVWEEVNPSLGSIFELENIKTAYLEAKQRPDRLNNFLRYRLNKWVGQYTRYIPMDKWDVCNGDVDEKKLKGRICYGGLDLSTSQDLTAFVLVFPPVEEDGKWEVLAKFYIPEERVQERVKKDSVLYDVWIREGHIQTVPGDTQGDYQFVRRDINKVAKTYKLKEVAFDPWHAGKIETELEEQDGITMVEHRQGFKSMSPPTKELLNYVLAEKLAHGDNPVLRWNVDNLAVKIDEAENVKPAKSKSADRIDGAVALIMALGRAIKNFESDSIYKNDRPDGLLAI